MTTIRPCFLKGHSTTNCPQRGIIVAFGGGDSLEEKVGARKEKPVVVEFGGKNRKIIVPSVRDCGWRLREKNNLTAITPQLYAHGTQERVTWVGSRGVFRPGNSDSIPSRERGRYCVYCAWGESNQCEVGKKQGNTMRRVTDTRDASSTMSGDVGKTLLTKVRVQRGGGTGALLLRAGRALEVWKRGKGNKRRGPSSAWSFVSRKEKSDILGGKGLAVVKSRRPNALSFQGGNTLCFVTCHGWGKPGNPRKPLPAFLSKPNNALTTRGPTT